MIKQKTTALNEKKYISVINSKQNGFRVIKRGFYNQSPNLYNICNKLNLNSSERRDFYVKIFSIK